MVADIAERCFASTAARQGPARSRGRRRAWPRHRAAMLRIDEVHVLRAEAHRLPVEAAFEQERAAGRPPPARGQAVGGTLEALLQLGLEAVVLLDREVAVAGGIDEGAGGPGRVGEQRLVPAAR